MRIVDTKIEPVSGTCFRLIVTFDDDQVTDAETTFPDIGGGPIRSRAIPDEIVHSLIASGFPYSLTLSEIHERVKGNPATINRQAWTLATNASDLQIRLRGWVYSPERGRYALTPAAIRVIEGSRASSLAAS